MKQTPKHAPGDTITTEATSATVTKNRKGQRQVSIETPIQRVVGHDHLYNRWFVTQGWAHKNELSNPGQRVVFPEGKRPPVTLYYEIDDRWVLSEIAYHPEKVGT